MKCLPILLGVASLLLGFGVMHAVDHSLDINIVDYSDAHYNDMVAGCKDDRTQQFIDGNLQLAPTFFNSTEISDSIEYGTPQNGILGDDFKRIEVYFYPGATKISPLTYAVRGRTKVKDNVCDFTGRINIRKVFRYDTDLPDIVKDEYVIVADYILEEDSTQNGSGVFKGVVGAYGYIPVDGDPNVIIVNDLNDVADGYENRTYVGQWSSYRTPSVVKRCVWGDYRLPYSFDFDCGDGELVPNPKYASPEWERYIYGEDVIYTEPVNHEYKRIYKSPWW